MNSTEYKSIRRAINHDLASIIELYSEVYDGTYPDQSFSDIYLLKESILKDFLFVAFDKDKVIACIKILYDPKNKIAKAGAAVVAEAYRGHNLTQELISHGIDVLKHSESGLEVLYAVTRTVNQSAQTLTENLGFKKLGIFPNVHKTNENETHALAAMYFGDALEKRYKDFDQHPKVMGHYKLAQKELNLETRQENNDFDKKNYDKPSRNMEIINAKNFVNYRKNKLIEAQEIDFAFFPFHTPTHLITNEDQTNEVFCYINKIDNYCVITGIKIDREVDLADLLGKVSGLLRNIGVRYVELLVRANRLNVIEKFLKAKFIPSGYFPSFQLENKTRYDYVVFSKSFEILDFNNINPKGLNKEFLKEYIRLWEEIYLNKI